ncbi:MAG: dephospho-CoA kinase [Gomphosphaeria aponina SAG 52.96 = DSM 107014]|uniref:Dephospho-CoA kinase n=1 Tax=Gomphosphaeria aponina SAG 52.96 = DSM 107014 TaxID=1521640 RepID=A0A941GZ42_9CHRO|nr:dephospho-CoA kinase [Gomphosphaeria aponina SAG 52.96 = DSM 107014]
MSQRLIGLTGGIATGKTTVSCYLANTYHVPILDADIYAREAVQPGSPILAAIFSKYSSKIKLPDGSLNRQALGEIIFHNPMEKAWLESKIHPYVRERFDGEIQRLDSEILVLVIPLLFEANLTDMVTEIWVVSCSREQQIRRLKTRNGINEEQAIARINSQFPLEKKVAAANIVLENNSDLDTLYQQIDVAFNN